MVGRILSSVPRGAVEPGTLPIVVQEICRRVESNIAEETKDASGVSIGGSITKGQSLQEQSGTEQTSIKTTNNPPETTTAAPMLSHLKYEHFVAGTSGGAISTLILHPLDLIKTRFAGTSTILSLTT